MELAAECEIVDQKPILTADGLTQQSQSQQQQQQQQSQQSIAASNLAATSTSAAAVTATSAVAANTPVCSALSGVHPSAVSVAASSKSHFPAENKLNILLEGEAAGSAAAEDLAAKKEPLAVNLDIEILPLIYDIIRW